MSKVAIIKTGGKQYKVSPGQIIKVEKLSAQPDSVVKLETLLVADGDKVEIGQPSLGERVEAKLVETAKDKKVTVVKYKNKIRYKKTIGHRQNFSRLEISKIA